MFKRYSKWLMAALISGLSIQASATLILETYGSATPNTVGGYSMTDFGLIAGNTGDAISSITSPTGGNVTMSNQYGNPVSLGFANSTTWWANGETSDNNIFTTSTRRITITLPENTLAFSFNVGANKGARAWLDAFETSGPGLTGSNRHYFGLGSGNTPGFGIYANNTGSECSYLSSIVVDPTLIWGVGNFSINQGSCNTSVPEPSSIALFAIGLIGLGIIRKQQ